MDTASMNQEKPDAPNSEQGSTTTLQGSQKSEKEQNVQDDKPRTVSGIIWALVVVAILSSTFLYALDNTVMATVRPSIVSDLGNIAMLPWLSVSYPLGEVGSNPIWGKLFGQFDNKFLYLAAILIFEVGSIVSASAHSTSVVVVGRVISGIGGSGTYVGTMCIFSAMTTIHERAQYLGYVGIAWGLGIVLGPIIGGAFADSSATWRWAFYINPCIAGVFAPVYIWLIPPLGSPSKDSMLRRLKQFDYLGALLWLGGILTIIMLLAFGGTLYSWGSATMIVLYVFTPVIWIAFAIQQRFKPFTKNNIFPTEFVSSLFMINMFSWTAIAISGLVVTVYTLPLLFQFVFDESALMAGVYMLPFMGAIVVSAGIGGAVLPKIPIYMAWFTVCAILMLVGSALLSTIHYGISKGAICGYSVIQALGCGAVAQLGFTVAQSKVAKDKSQQVASFLTCAQMGGLALSLGMSTCIFMNTATNDIESVLPGVSRSTLQAALSGASGDNVLQSLPSSEKSQILSIIAKDLGHVFYMSVAGAALGLVTALLMPRERVNFEGEDES